MIDFLFLSIYVCTPLSLTFPFSPRILKVQAVAAANTNVMLIKGVFFLNNTDFSNFILSNEAQDAFDLFIDSDQAVLSYDQFLLLYELDLICPSIGDQNFYCIDLSKPLPKIEQGMCYLSDYGKQYRNFLKYHSRQSSKHIKEQKKQNLINIFINFVIAATFYLLGLFSEEIKIFLMRFFQ